MSAALALLASLAAAAPSVPAVMAEVRAIVELQPGRDAREVEKLDMRADALFRKLEPLGWRAAAPLGEAARDLKRPAKARLFAVRFLGRLRDPAAFAPLAAALADPEQDPDVRSAAAQALGALDVPPEPLRRALCPVLLQPELPRPVLDDALVPASRLGCADPAPLSRAAKLGGLRPAGADLEAARRALAGLGRSRGEAPAAALLELAAWFPPREPARAAALQALAAKAPALTGPLRPRALPVLREALRSETGSPENAILLIRLVERFGPEAAPALAPLAAHPDAEVLAEAAEALARLGAVSALPALESAVAGAMRDPRFSPREGRPEPAVLLARLEAARDRLRRARGQAR